MILPHYTVEQCWNYIHAYKVHLSLETSIGMSFNCYSHYGIDNSNSSVIWLQEGHVCGYCPNIKSIVTALGDIDVQLIR